MPRIARGLFRLWLVAAIVWIALMGLLEWPNANAFGLLDSGDIQTAVGVIFIPPLLLLMLGSALGWAIKGFRN